MTQVELVPQAQRLRDALEASGGNVSEAARQLGLSREYVHELMRTYGISIVREVRVAGQPRKRSQGFQPMQDGIDYDSSEQ